MRPALAAPLLVTAAFAGGTLVAAAGVTTPGDGDCPPRRPLEDEFAVGLQVWPFGTECETYAMAPSVPGTLLAIALTAVVLVLGVRRRDDPVARALVGAAATLAVIGLVVHSVGYPPAMFAGVLCAVATLVVETRLRRDVPTLAEMLAAMGLGGVVWLVATFFQFWGWPVVGVLLAPAAAVAYALAATRLLPPPEPRVAS